MLKKLLKYDCIEHDNTERKKRQGKFVKIF